MLYGDIGHARIGAADLHQSRSRGISDHPCWDAAAHRFYCAAVGFVVRTAGTIVQGNADAAIVHLDFVLSLKGPPSHGRH